LLAAGAPRVVALCGVQGWRWAWAREVRKLVFALDADAAGQQQWRALAREAALRGKQITVLEPTAYGGCKDVNEAWMAGMLTLGGGAAVRKSPEGRELPEDLWDAWEERAAIIECDGGLARSAAEQAAWHCLTAASPL